MNLSKDLHYSLVMSSYLDQQDKLHFFLAVIAQTTTPIMAMGRRQCLPLSVVQLKGKHCRKPHCRNGVVTRYVWAIRI